MARPVGRQAKTKLIATIGPASRDGATLDALFDAGLDVCRINFSHGEIADHQTALTNIRAMAAQRDLPIAILGDLCGPKIRLGQFAGDGADLQTAHTVRIARGEHFCTENELTVSYPGFVDQVNVGERVLIDDGLVRLKVAEKRPGSLVCAVTAGGKVSSRKGVNLPDTRLDLPALTEKDLRDLQWAIEQELDYIALSFVRRPDDLYQLKRILKERESQARVIIKIEKAEALEHVDELIENSDGVLVARGDLGVEMELWQVPLIQKDLTARCRSAGVPVIIATQMLQSMVQSPTPTRAEVSDVANAIFDGADAVMLSAETAVGAYPVLAVEVMNRIAVATEEHIDRKFTAGAAAEKDPIASLAPINVMHTGVNYTPGRRGLPITSAVSSAAAHAALELGARLVAVRTASGNSARLIARERLPMPVVGLTWDPRVARRINLIYGVIPLSLQPLTEPESLFAALDPELLRLNLARAHDLIVIVTATQPARAGGTNAVFVHVVGTPAATSATASSST